MKHPVNQRVREVIDYYDLNANSFAKRLGYERSDTVYNIVSDRHRASQRVLDDVLRIFKDLNANWLMRGEGSMLLESDTKEFVAKPTDGEVNLLSLINACENNPNEENFIRLKEGANQIMDEYNNLREFAEKFGEAADKTVIGTLFKVKDYIFPTKSE